MKHGADIDTQTGSGDVPLDFAKRTGNPNSFLRAGTVTVVIFTPHYTVQFSG